MAALAHGHQPVVIFGAVHFEKVAQVEQRSAEDAALAEQKSDEQPADATVAIEKRVDGFKLRVDEAEVHERWQRIGVVQKLFQVAERVIHLRHGRRDETRV